MITLTRSASQPKRVTSLHCTRCDDSGHVCAEHTFLPWGGVSQHEEACFCPAGGRPCPSCVSPLPRDTFFELHEFFVPRARKH